MITAGIDAGSEYLKAVLLNDDSLLAWSDAGYGRQSVLAVATAGINEVADKAGIARASIERIAAAGTNREKVDFAHEYLLESLCCAQGVNHLVPSGRTIIDLGSDKATVIKCADGTVLQTARNDRCAAGTARYLQITGKLLQVPEEKTGEISLQSMNPVNLEATCTVFVESEIISLIHQGKRPEDILKGVFRALVRRIYPLMLKVGLNKDVVLIGGMAKNIGIVAALEEQIGYKPVIPEHPAIVEALGAALLARHKDE